MRSFILFVLSFFSFASYCQLPGDSLSKYSYGIMSFNNQGAKGQFGTCFFIKKNSLLFLVTAKHVLYKCDSSSNKVYSPYNLAIVQIPHPLDIMQITIPPRTDSCLSIEKDTDLLVISVDPSWSNRINSVEEFMEPKFNRVWDAEIFGQGWHSDSIRLTFDNQHHIYLPANSFKIEQAVRYGNSDFIDSVDYTFTMKEIYKNKSINGFSGSPVFLQDKNSKKWRIAGVLVGVANASNGNKKRLFVVKQEYISKYIKELISTNSN
jgi:hypothetical protein